MQGNSWLAWEVFPRRWEKRDDFSVNRVPFGSPCILPLSSRCVSCYLHAPERSHIQWTPSPPLVYPYNTIGNESLPCNFLFFIIIFHLLSFLSGICQYVVLVFLFMRCLARSDDYVWLNSSSSSHCDVEVLYSWMEFRLLSGFWIHVSSKLPLWWPRERNTNVIMRNLFCLCCVFTDICTSCRG